MHCMWRRVGSICDSTFHIDLIHVLNMNRVILDACWFRIHVRYEDLLRYYMRHVNSRRTYAHVCLHTDVMLFNAYCLRMDVIVFIWIRITCKLTHTCVMLYKISLMFTDIDVPHFYHGCWFYMVWRLLLHGLRIVCTRMLLHACEYGLHLNLCTRM